MPEAIADAKENAARNGINKRGIFVGKAEEVLPLRNMRRMGFMRM